MKRFSLFGIPATILLLWSLIFLGSLVLPSSNVGIFASPDETAVATSIVQIQATGSAAKSEPLASTLPWLHPRSYLAVGDALVPVGFLGWPWWLAQFNRFFPLVAVAWIASLIAASGCIPWYLLLRKRFGPTAAWWGTLLAWTFPPVLLYVNRSLFSHLPQYSLALWAVWLLVACSATASTGRKQLQMRALAGFLFGVALSFRPMEAIWLIPVACLLWSRFEAIRWRKQGLVLGGMLLGLIPLFVVQALTYGSWFDIGYWMQANVDPSAVVIPQIGAPPVRAWYLAIAPYGIHPKNIWWNIRSFFGSFLWPWAVVVSGMVFYGALMFFARVRAMGKKALSSSVVIPAVCLFGVCVWLLLIYGSGLYTDHVRVGAVTVANSFLRYLLPVGFFFAWAVAQVYAKIYPSFQKRIVFSGVLSLVALMGVYSAFFRDEEGIWATRHELVRYAAVRSAALTTFSSEDVILSERSDKIFFPLFRAVTPLPTSDQIKYLATYTSSTALGLFSRPLSFSERDAWRKIGYDVHELQTFDRERLYRLTPFLR